MKKTILTTALLFLISGISWGQGMETFDNFTETGASYSIGTKTFTGQDGFIWNYVEVRGDKSINGKALMLRDNLTTFLKSDNITGGIGELRFAYMQTYTGNVKLDANILDENDVVINSFNVTTSSEQNIIKISDVFQVGYNGNFKLEFKNTATGKHVAIDDIEWSAFGQTLPQDPIIVASPTSITGFDYYEGDGPSVEQSFSVSGTNLDSDISIATTNSDFQISTTTGSGFSSSVTLTQTGGDVANTDIYVRLKEGLTAANYTDVLTITSTNADPIDVSLSGEVKVPLVNQFGIPYSNGFRNQEDFDQGVADGFTSSGLNQELGAGGYLKINNAGYLETPTIDFTAYDELEVSFSMQTYGSGSGREFSTFISTDDGVNYDLLDTFNVPSSYEAFATVIDLTGANNVTTGKIKFEMTAGTAQTRFRDLNILRSYVLTIGDTEGVNDNEGWRMLSSPTSDNTYADLLGSIWTQGFPGANYEVNDVDPSVREFKASPIDSFEVITNLSNPMTPGQGFITYVYQDDVYDPLNPGTGTFPKTLTLTGTENSGTITPTLNSGADAWTLVGNPYASIIEWGNDIVKTDLTGVVYVYDHSYDPIVEIGKDTLANPEAGGGYRTWNGTAGGLKDGKIATFQGFWVQNAATITTGPVLEITEDAKSVSGNKFYKQSTQSASFRMIAQMDGFANDAYFSFTNEGKIGKDNYDGLKLEPLDYADYLSLGTEVEGVLMDINNLPWDIKESVEFPVEINSFTKLDDGYALKGGEVTLSLADLKNIPADWGIVFNNYNTGETIDLRTQESYTFQLAAKAKMVKAKTAFSVLSPAGITREKSMGSSGFSITIQPDKTPVNLEPKDEPRVFALEQNYPNPFNPTTTIKYSVAETGAVSLAVYNIMGQKVADLVNSTKQAGNYAISWQAQDMASGLYFYRLSAAGQTITRQMTLIK